MNIHINNALFSEHPFNCNSHLQRTQASREVELPSIAPHSSNAVHYCLRESQLPAHTVCFKLAELSRRVLIHTSPKVVVKDGHHSKGHLEVWVVWALSDLVRRTQLYLSAVAIGASRQWDPGLLSWRDYNTPA